MVSPETMTEICRHLIESGYELINVPDAPAGGPADAAIVAQKDRTRTLFFIAICDDQRPYHVTPIEAAAQYILQKQQFAAHIEVIRTSGPPQEITYSSLR